jgi:FMN-dependent NADH-azoreductase
VKILRIDSSARHDSISRQLTSTFIEAWKLKHPLDEIKQRDLASTRLPLITSEWSGVFGDPAKLTAAQKQYLALSDTLTDEIREADLIVIGAPVHNFTISWPLKAWIDQIVRPGKTVLYSAGRPQGLLSGKKVVIITASGGSRPAYGSPELVDFMESYLLRVLQFIGLTDVTFIRAENQGRAVLAETSRSAAIEQIHAIVEQTRTGLVSEAAI